MIIIGIDPGTQVTGYGIIRKEGNKLVVIDFGCIRPSRKENLSRRYYIIFDAIKDLITKYQPQAVAVESQYMSKNVQSAMKLGMAKGAAIIAATSMDVPIYEYSPTKAKKAVVGNGLASKEQVQRMVKMLLGLPSLSEPQDVYDAFSLAICHAHSEGMNLGSII